MRMRAIAAAKKEKGPMPAAFFLLSYQRKLLR